MITGIQRFRQQDGLEVLKVWLAPTPQFPNGSFFYCEAKDEDLVRMHPNWTIHKQKKPYVEARASRASAISGHYCFHIEVAKKYCSELPEAIDHYNGVGFDCVNRPNLFSVTQEQNSRNRRIRGYILNRSGSFCARIMPRKEDVKSNPVRTEVEALIDRSQLEKRYFSDYNYNFLADRRTSLDLLMQEREGIISHEDAVFLYLQRYIDNPWYYFRYDLANAYNYYGLEKPEEGKDYWVAKDGFMVNKDGVRLVPIDWLNKRA